MLEAESPVVETESTVAPVDTGQPDQTAAGEASERQEAASEERQEPEQRAEEAEKEPKPPGNFVQRRIDELTRARREAERRAQDLEAELARYRQPEQQPDTPEAPTREQYERDVRAEAARQAQAARFDADCNAIFDKGKEAYPDWEGALGNFRMVGGLPPELIEMASETGEAHRVLYELGKNPEEADRIMRMTPARAAVAIAKMASAPAKQPAISKAPEPVRPIGAGSGTVEKDPSKMTMSEWVAWRNKSAAA